MRRFVVVSLGVLELVAALVLAFIAWQLPGPADINEAAGRVEEVSRNAGRQVGVLRKQIVRVRQRQPELAKLATRLEKQMRNVRDHMGERSLNGENLAAVSNSLGQVAQGLDGLSQTLNPKAVEYVGKSLSITATYLDGKVVPAAENTAASLEKASAGLRTDAGKLSAFLKESPPELKATRSIVDSMARFEEGLERAAKVAKVENFEAIRDGFKGMQTSLDSGADQIDRFSKFTLPKVTVKGFKLEVEEKSLWPDSKDMADGMRKAAKGCAAASKELESINKELPQLRASLDESRKVISTTRQSLAKALDRQEKIEPVLKRLPAQLAQLADTLPQLTDNLANVLRETAKLKEVANALRQADRAVTAASEHWPELRQGLAQSAKVLRATQKQLKSALAGSEEYEKMLRDTVSLTTLFAEALPVTLRHLETGLEQQEGALGELQESINKVTESLPPAADSASRLMVLTRMLVALIALVVAVHAGYSFAGARS